MAAVFCLGSCKKEETTPSKNVNQQQKQEAFQNVAKRQLTLNASYVKLTGFVQGLLAKSAQYMKKEDGIENPFGCAVLTIDSSSSPRIATFDFGTGCTDATGKYYSGSIVIEYLSADMSAAGSGMHVTFNSFLVDTISYDGTLDYTNNGVNGSGHPSGTINVSGTTEFVHDRMRLTGTNTATFETVTARNTSYVSFSGSGTDNNGINFTQSTNSPLEFKAIDGCTDHFTSGRLLISSPSMPDEEIDYGTGTCDDQATSTILGVTTPITLQ